MDIADLIRESVNDCSIPLWWPGLAEVMVADRMMRLPFDPPRYSTSRFVAGLEPIQTRAITPSDAGAKFCLRIECMPAILEAHFMGRGLALASTCDISEEVVQIVAVAMSQISLAPSLGVTVGTLARSVHLLTVEDPSYDVSFSDPSIPFSIFVSASHGSEADIRLAEAIIHESMHLQLSLVEQFIPLVDDRHATFYSPWKREERPLAGIVHGLYVFRVIDQWLAYIASEGSYKSYIARRRSQIAEEMQLTKIGHIEAGLTLIGRRLVSRLVMV